MTIIKGEKTRYDAVKGENPEVGLNNEIKVENPEVGVIMK